MSHEAESPHDSGPPLVIDEQLVDDGSYRRLVLDAVGERVLVREGTDVSATFSTSAIIAIMDRYARPLEVGVTLDGPVVRLTGGAELQRLRFRAGVDALARDYLVLRRPSKEPVAVLSKTVASALRFLVRGASV